MAWFTKDKEPKTPLAPTTRKKIPEGLWTRCENCKEIIYSKEIARNDHVCPKCNYHFRISARSRLESLLDDGRYEEFATGILPTDPLNFKDTKRYKDRLKIYAEKCGMPDALICAAGRLGGRGAILCAMEYAFIGGSMGSVVGEKVTRAIERALAERLPLIIISSSGGARMKEGALSLMQMAKTSSALARLHEAGVPYISILTDPTTGGVTASLRDARRREHRRTGGADRFRRPAGDQADHPPGPPRGLPALGIPPRARHAGHDRRAQEDARDADQLPPGTSAPTETSPRRDRPMTYEQAIAYLYGLAAVGIKLGLRRTRVLLRALGSPERSFPCVLVAGTNGKGSVAAMIHRALRAAGLRAALYTSPHLVRFEERIVVGDEPMPREEVAASAERLQGLIRGLLAGGGLDSHPTYFEVVTAMALAHFAGQGAEAAVLEVGLGGRFDATNAVEPAVSVITRVALDHTEYLGSALRQVAFEKAGILRPLGQAVTSCPRGRRWR